MLKEKTYDLLQIILLLIFGLQLTGGEPLT